MQNHHQTPTLSTRELAALLKVRPQSIRAAVCRAGHWLGMKPVKLANRLLLWNADEALRIAEGK